MKDNAKHAVAVVAAVTALVTAMSSCNESMQQRELKATQKIYGVIGEKIEEIDEQLEKLHRDDVELRAYLEGYREAMAALERHEEKQTELGRRNKRRRRPSDPDPEPAPTAIRVLPPPPKPKAAPAVAELPDFGQAMQFDTMRVRGR